MKKIISALIIVVFALAVSSYALTPGKLSLGIDTAIANLSIANAGAAYLGYNINGQIKAALGLNYNSYKTAAAASTTTSQTGISARVSYYLPMTLGSSAAVPLVGVQYSADGASTAASIISLLLGAEVGIADGVVMNIGLIPYSTCTTGGNSDSAIATGSSNTSGRGIFIGGAFDLN
ncbi:hypothetical protein ACFL5U_01655 [Candidatus Margulisiibacteriota bacterium]